MPDLEAVGEAVTGAAVARAVEPNAGGGDGHTEEAHCLNCGCDLSGPFCHCCGQRAHVHRTLGAFWHDLLHGVLHFEGKTWRTLPMLGWRPGELTRRYIEGERAKFVSPLAVFLFSVFLMFAVFSLMGRAAYYVEDEVVVARGEPGRANPVEVDLSDAPAPLKVFEVAYQRAKENPSLLFYKVQTNAYKFSWLLIPLSVPLVWLLFLHRRRYRRFTAYDHTVFVTYSIAFMSLFAIAYTLLKLGGLIGTLALLPFVVPPLHMYRQLRGAYQLSRWSALWRTGALALFALLTMAIFFSLLLMVGVLG